jgi:phosphoribosylformimino-5-aminoimidazole carboxamide ribotide isomerase
MIVYPAVDIRGGKAVQLVEGDYSRETIFDADPVDAARRWADAGATWIHIVDLDGARDGVRANQDAIARIRKAVNVKLELGGGLRTMDDLDAMYALGIDRLVIGSAAVTNPKLVTKAVVRFGGLIGVGLDARDGKLASHGWLDQSDVDALEAARRFAVEGVEHVIFTDIRRDGNMQGPNLDALKEMIDTVPANVIASGGISSLQDLEAVQDLGAAGAIIGSALYKGAIGLPDALAMAAGKDPS